MYSWFCDRPWNRKSNRIKYHHISSKAICESNWRKPQVGPGQWAQTGFRISLNYLMEFNSKRIPNSSRIPNECDLLCAMTYPYICCFCCFLASAKRVALLFLGLPRKGATCFAQSGSRLFPNGQVSTNFSRLLRLLGQDLNTNDPGLEKLRPALRKAGRALGIITRWKSCDLLCGCEGWANVKKQNSQNEVVCIGKCYHTLGERL